MIKKWKFDGIEVELIQDRRGKKASVPELIILYVLEGEAKVSVAESIHLWKRWDCTCECGDCASV